jgi:hypothetical protein
MLVIFASPEWAGYEGGVFPSISAALKGEGGDPLEEVNRGSASINKLAKWLRRE